MYPPWSCSVVLFRGPVPWSCSVVLFRSPAPCSYSVLQRRSLRNRTFPRKPSLILPIIEEESLCACRACSQTRLGCTRSIFAEEALVATTSSTFGSFRGRGLRKRYAALLRPLEQLFPSWLHPVKRVQTNGLDLHLDARTESTNEVSLTDGGYEQEETEFMEGVVQPGNVFVDIGANVGYFTCLASRWVGEAGQVYAIEPDRINFRHLRRNVRTNKCTANVQAVRAAASEAEGTTVLHRSLVNCGDHRIYADGVDTRIGEPVRTVAVDDFVAAAPRVDFVKMDVQGAETLVLDGMQQTLAANAEHIALLIEWWPYGLAQSGSSAVELRKRLTRHGLSLWTMDGEPATGVCAPGLETQSEHYVNVVATREWRW